MYLVVGLGNPGPRYSLTRHNAGFIFLDFLAEGLSAKFQEKRSYEALYTEVEFAGTRLCLLKPQTFMNLSGRSVAAVLRNTEITPDKILVFHDEVEIPAGDLRIKMGGGDAGHNGLKSIRDSIGTGDFYRFRMGVGRPSNPQMDLAAYVLERYAKSEQELLMSQLENAEACLEIFINEGLQKAQMKAST
ncbi:MAG: aminoacyl-tRNA hydrolase [Bdellovibrionota bacterium]